MSWWLDITDLDDDQKNVIALPANGSYLVVGPPGSGKTNLLLLRAEFLIRLGHPNVCVLMFNDPLHDFVVRGGSHYAVPREKIRKTLSWQLTLLREHGIVMEAEPDDDLAEKRALISNRVLNLLKTKPALKKHMECLLIDEIQDCIPEEIEVFFQCAKYVCFAGDSGQRISGSADVITDLRKRIKTLELSTHYRIGHEICRVADAIGKAAGLDPIEDDCNYKGPKASVRFYSCGSDEEQARRLIETLAIQLTAYPDELLGVAAPRKIDRDFLRAALMNSPLAEFVLPHRESGSLDPQQRIYIAHLTEIKGLEFRTMHLALLQHLHKLRSHQKRIAFTAVTRGKTTVTLYYTGTIPGYLEQAQVLVEPPKPKPPIEDLFPKKGKATP